MSQIDNEPVGESGPKQQRVDDAIPEVDSEGTDEPVNRSYLVGTGHELLLEGKVEGQPHRFLIDSGVSVSLVKPGVSQAEVFPTNMAARGITETKLISLGSKK